MVKIKYIKIVFVISILLISCKTLWYNTPKFIKKGFTFKFVEKETCIDSLINIKGYYHESIIWDRIEYMPQIDIFGHLTIDTNEFKIVVDTFDQYLIFFKDGICVNLVNNSSLSMAEYIAEIINDDSLGIVNEFYNLNKWGRYIINEDTIKMQLIDRPIIYSSDRSWQAYEVYYLIMHNNTLQRIYTRPIYKQKSDIENFYNYYQKGRMYLPAIFVETEALPSSDGWIKEKIWFWKNKADWEKYNKKIKTKF
jgi:hypothetical protein